MSSPCRQQRITNFSPTTTLSSIPLLCLPHEDLGIQYLFSRPIKASHWPCFLCPNSPFLSHPQRRPRTYTSQTSTMLRPSFPSAKLTFVVVHSQIHLRFPHPSLLDPSYCPEQEHHPPFKDSEDSALHPPGELSIQDDDNYSHLYDSLFDHDALPTIRDCPNTVPPQPDHRVRPCQLDDAPRLCTSTRY